jgi:hypothetical protein
LDRSAELRWLLQKKTPWSRQQFGRTPASWLRDHLDEPLSFPTKADRSLRLGHSVKPRLAILDNPVGRRGQNNFKKIRPSIVTITKIKNVEDGPSQGPFFFKTGDPLPDRLGRCANSKMTRYETPEGWLKERTTAMSPGSFSASNARQKASKSSRREAFFPKDWTIITATPA